VKVKVGHAISVRNRLPESLEEHGIPSGKTDIQRKMLKLDRSKHFWATSLAPNVLKNKNGQVQTTNS
jgi:hypothetical protein